MYGLCCLHLRPMFMLILMFIYLADASHPMKLKLDAAEVAGRGNVCEELCNRVCARMHVHEKPSSS